MYLTPEVVIGMIRGSAEIGQLSNVGSGHPSCPVRGVFHRLVRAIVMLVPATTCAARLHAHSIPAVDATQELTRCLRTVRLVLARREHKVATSVSGQTTTL